MWHYFTNNPCLRNKHSCLLRSFSKTSNHKFCQNNADLVQNVHDVFVTWTKHCGFFFQGKVFVCLRWSDLLTRLGGSSALNKDVMWWWKQTTNFFTFKLMHSTQYTWSSQAPCNTPVVYLALETKEQQKSKQTLVKRHFIWPPMLILLDYYRCNIAL